MEFFHETMPEILSDSKQQPEPENSSKESESETHLRSCEYDYDGDCSLSTICENVMYQTDMVHVPIRILPCAEAGPYSMICCGSPVVTPGHNCQGQINGTCEFTVSQKICVKIPLRFHADVITDNPLIQCGGVTCEENS